MNVWGFSFDWRERESCAVRFIVEHRLTQCRMGCIKFCDHLACGQSRQYLYLCYEEDSIIYTWLKFSTPLIW